MRICFLAVLSFFCFSLTSTIALAESEPDVPLPIEQGDVELSESGQKEAEKIVTALEKLNDSVDDIVSDLGSSDAQHFMTIYNNYITMNAIEIVRSDVSNAVASCKDNNPDEEELHEDLDERFEMLDDVTDLALKDGRAQLDRMIKSQKYAKAKKIRSVFKQADRVRNKTLKAIEKVPVTTLDACRALAKNIGKTQESLASLMQNMLVDMSQDIDVENQEQPE